MWRDQCGSWATVRTKAAQLLICDWQSLIKLRGCSDRQRCKPLATKTAPGKRRLPGSHITSANSDRPPVRKSFMLNRTVLEYTTAGSVNQSLKRGPDSEGPVSSLRPTLDQPRPDQRCPERVDQGGQRPDVVGQFLALIA